MSRMPALLATSALLTMVVGCDGASLSTGQSLSTVSPTCEPMAGSVSGGAFDNEEATRVIDMVDHATEQELIALNGIGTSHASE